MPRNPIHWNTILWLHINYQLPTPLQHATNTRQFYPILALQFGLRLVSSATCIANEFFHLYLKIALCDTDPLIFNHCFDCPVVLFYNPILARSTCSSIILLLKVKMSITTSSRGPSLSSAVRLGKASLLMSFFPPLNILLQLNWLPPHKFPVWFKQKLGCRKNKFPHDNCSCWQLM